MLTSSDGVLRTMTDDGTFRVVTACTTKTVRGALGAQAAEGDAARHFADLLTGVVLLRETMAPQLRVQGILRGAKRTGTVVADSHPTGRTRGLISRAAGSSGIELGDGAVLQLMRTLHDGRLQQGLVEVPREGGISEALMTYMQVSEQVTTMIAVGTVFDEARTVVAAGGYLVQLLPGGHQGPLRLMTDRLEGFTQIQRELVQPGYCPRSLNQRLLDRIPFTELGESEVRFKCWCSQVGVMSALATLPRSEIQEMIDDGEVLEISCDYCHREYRVAPSELRGLLEPS